MFFVAKGLETLTCCYTQNRVSKGITVADPFSSGMHLIPALMTVKLDIDEEETRWNLANVR
jgi:hypothetical protein